MIRINRRKNKDYGDAFAESGSIGVLIRLGDKLKRLQSISKTSICLIDSESSRDTLIDLHNYSAMAIMLLDEASEKTLVPANLDLEKEEIEYSNDEHIKTCTIL